jgi:hypothetical protein
MRLEIWFAASNVTLPPIPLGRPFSAKLLDVIIGLERAFEGLVILPFTAASLISPPFAELPEVAYESEYIFEFNKILPTSELKKISPPF